jgi:chromosome segregation ATPase
MEFCELATNETAALITRINAHWAQKSAGELRTLHDILTAAAQAAEAAVVTASPAKIEHVNALADQLAADADSCAKALAKRVAKDAETSINAVRKELQDRSQEKDQLAATLGEVQSEVDRLRQELQAQTARAKNAERDLENSQRELEAARAESTCVMQQLEAEAAERAKLTVAFNTAQMLQRQHRVEHEKGSRARPETAPADRNPLEYVAQLAALPISRLRAKFQRVEDESTLKKGGHPASTQDAKHNEADHAPMNPGAMGSWVFFP